MRAEVEVSDTIISKAEFARLCGVTSARVSQWLRDGVVTKEALLGKGRHARVRAELAKSMLRDRLDPDRRTAHLNVFQLPGEAPADDRSGLTAARTRTASLQAALLQMRLARELGDVIPKAAATATVETLGRAVRRALAAGPGWSEGKFLGAAQTGGLAAVSGLLRAKFAELGNSIADLITATEAELIDGE